MSRKPAAARFKNPELKEGFVEMRFRDAALAVTVIVTAPAMAGTPVANSSGMEITVPNLVPIPVAEPTPASGAAGLPVPVASATAASGPAVAAEAEKPVPNDFETLIADFRWGDPEMGAAPYLRIPPAHKMRAEDVQQGGEGAPLDGNGGNALPLQLVSLPLAADPTRAATTNNLPTGASPGPTGASPGAASRALRGSAGDIPVPTGSRRPDVTNGFGPSAGESPSAATTPAPSSDQPSAGAQAELEKIERQILERARTMPGPERRGASESISPTSTSPTSSSSTSPVPTASIAPASSTLPPASTLPLATTLPPGGLTTHAASHGHSLAGPGLSAAAERTTASTLESRRAQARTDVRNVSGAAASAVGANVTGKSPAVDAASFERMLQAGGAGIARDTIATDAFGERSTASAANAGASNESAQTFTLAAGSAAGATAGAGATNGSPAARGEPTVLQLGTPMTQPEWADGLGEQVVWLANQNLENAHIRLNPAHLGPLEVRVSVADDRASVAFAAHHALTREALEAAAPRLREMLQAQGFANVNVEVGQQSHQSAGQRGQGERPQYAPSLATDDARDSRAYAPARTPGPRSVLDTFA